MSIRRVARLSRKDQAMIDHRIYLDQNATTPILKMSPRIDSIASSI